MKADLPFLVQNDRLWSVRPSRMLQMVHTKERRAAKRSGF
jgi:hypothetical protein